jgi:hypothetical protein
MNAKRVEYRPERQLSPLLTSSEHNNGDRLAALDEDEVTAEGGLDRRSEGLDNEKDEKVTWASLPHRRQLIILTLARLSEPLVQTSLQVSTPKLAAKRNHQLAVFAGIYVLSAQIIR